MCRHCELMEQGMELVGLLKIATAHQSHEDTRFAMAVKKGDEAWATQLIDESMRHRRSCMDILIQLGKINKEMDEFRRSNPEGEDHLSGLSSGQFEQVMGGADVQRVGINLMDQDQNMTIADLIRLIQGGAGRKPS